MSAPDFVKKSALANAGGWLDVDKGTLRHVRFPKVFGLGDASSLPTSKTGAAIRKQAPVAAARRAARSPRADWSRSRRAEGSRFFEHHGRRRIISGGVSVCGDALMPSVFRATSEP